MKDPRSNEKRRKSFNMIFAENYILCKLENHHLFYDGDSIEVQEILHNLGITRVIELYDASKNISKAINAIEKIAYQLE